MVFFVLAGAVSRTGSGLNISRFKEVMDGMGTRDL